MSETVASAGGVNAWALPPRMPPPANLERTRAGAVTLRYPKSDRDLQRRLIDSLRRSRPALAMISNDELVHILGSVGEGFSEALDADTVQMLAREASLSVEMTGAVLEGMTPTWSRSGLRRLLAAELRDPRSLEAFAATGERRVRASAPGVTLHFGAGSVPGVTVTSVLRALLARSPVLVKPGAGDVLLTTLFVRALHRADPRLAASVAALYWPGGADAWRTWERDALTLVDQVAVYGRNETIESIRARAPASTRLVEHPDRLGVAVVDPGGDPGAAAAAARAVALFDQRGCVSTHLFLLLADAPQARAWCGRLARRLSELGRALPPGPASPGELSGRHQLARAALLRIVAAGAGRDAAGYWASHRARWAVLLGPASAFAPVGGRTAWVAPVGELESCARALAPLRGALQSVGLAGVESGREWLREELAALGATRIAALERVPFPEPEWLHDGARPLGELIRWSEARD